MDEDWAVLVSLLPPEWRELARHTRALKGLRKDKSAETLLRVLLLHLGCGHSLRETVVRARKAKLAQLSDVALLKRLRKSRGWLHALCVELFREQGVGGPGDGGFEVRAFDATTVKEPGRTGALWRIHYSVRLPSLTCDFFKLTASDGEGAGESFAQFPIRAGDHVAADRGYSTAGGIGHVAASGGHVLVRVNTGSLRLRTCTGERFDWLAELGSLTRTGAVQSWPTVAVGDGVTVPGRVCAARKSTEAIRIAQDKLREEAARKGRQVQPHTLQLARTIVPRPPLAQAIHQSPESIGQPPAAPTLPMSRLPHGFSQSASTGASRLRRPLRGSPQPLRPPRDEPFGRIEPLPERLSPPGSRRKRGFPLSRE